MTHTKAQRAKWAKATEPPPMTFKHFLRVGFFGLSEEKEARRDLSVDECLALFREFCRLAPESVDCQITPSIGNQHVELIGMCDGKHIAFRRQGLLEVPYMDYSNTNDPSTPRPPRKTRCGRWNSISEYDLHARSRHAFAWLRNFATIERSK